MSRDALVIGINTYCDAQMNLTAPAQDAESLAQILEKYGEFNVTRLPAVKDKQNNKVRVGQKTAVTLTQLEEAIVQLFKPEGKNLPDTALLYFSGHGLRKNRGIQEGFLATSDVNANLGNWGLSLHWLRQLLQESEIKQQVIWLDCCHSGELLNFAEADPGDRGKGRDRCFIAASREFEKAYEAIGSNHSVLTDVLLQGLNPKQHPEIQITNYTLIDWLNQHWPAYPQRPIFANSGSAINLTCYWKTLLPAPVLPFVCPYRGLQYFDFKEEDAKYFYGRETLTDELLDKVRFGKFLAVLGASGSGKSSVVRAGLLYQLKLGRRLSRSEQWQIKILQPGKHPLQSLALAFVDAGLSEIEQASQLAKAEKLIATGANGVKRLIKVSNAPRVLLVIDQFEEVFTLCQDDSERKHFFECLIGAVLTGNSKFCLVIAMRADFLGKCAEQDYSGLARQIQQNLVTVTPMTRDELKQAIIEPAKLVGLQVEPELVEEILADVEGSPGSLPLLEYTLKELWQQQKLTLAGYTHLGGVKGTLEKRATEVYESFSREEQQIAKRIFLELTQLGEGTEDTRRRVLLRDLVPSPQKTSVVEQVIGKLADEKVRLLVTSSLMEKGSESGQIAVVDVAHEALIRNWSLLRQWINESREAIRQKRKIETAAQEWLDNGKVNDYLLQGLKLAQAEDFFKSYADKFPLSSSAQDLIAVSQAERDYHTKQEEERRQRELHQERKARQAYENTTKVGLVSTVLVSAVAILAFALWIEARHQSSIAQLQSMNIIATQSLNSDSQMDALIANIKVGKQLQQVKQLPVVDTVDKNQIVANLRYIIGEMREQNRLVGHEYEVNSVAFSPDGKTLASASFDNTVKLWRTNGTLITTFKGHQDRVNGVAFSPDGKTLASASWDKTVKLWRTDGTLITTFKGHQNRVYAVAFSPDGKMLASTDWDGIVKLWRIDGTLITTFKGHQDRVNGVAFSPDGKTLASASWDKTVKLWRTDGNLITTLTGHQDRVNSVAFSPNGKTLASASWDKTVKLWRIDGSLITTLTGHNEWVKYVTFSPDGKTLASSSQDLTVKLWRNDGTLITTLEGHKSTVNGLSFSPDGKMIASASWDNIVKLWRIDQTLVTDLIGHKMDVYSIAFSPDGKTIASASLDKTVKLWRTDGTLITTFKGHDNSVYTVAFSPNGKTVASGSGDKTVKLWRIDGSLITTLKGHEDIVASVFFSPDGKSIASGSWDKTVKLWRSNGSLITTLKGHEYEVNSVAFSPDGKSIASGSNDKTVKLWRTDGTLITTFKGHENPVYSVAFSPDGKIIASGSEDKTVKLWRTDGTLINTLTEHKDRILRVAFSPDGKSIASGSQDKTVKLWRTDGNLITSLTEHKAKVDDVAFSPDGKTLAYATDDNTVKLWSLRNIDNLDYWLKEGCNWLGVYLNNPNNGMNPNDVNRHVCDDVKS